MIEVGLFLAGLWLGYGLWAHKARQLERRLDLICLTQRSCSPNLSGWRQLTSLLSRRGGTMWCHFGAVALGLLKAEGAVS